MAALLTSERANTDKMVQYIGECRAMGIDVLPPDCNQSTMHFTVVENSGGYSSRSHPPAASPTPPLASGEVNSLAFSEDAGALPVRGSLPLTRHSLSRLAAIKNVGEGAVEAILSARSAGGPFRSLFDFCERVDLRAVNRRVVESFIKSGSFDTLEKRRAALLAAIDRAMEAGQKQQRDRDQGQASLLGMLGGAEPGAPRAPERLPDVADWPEGERLAYEKESLGFFITGHPLERYRVELAQWANATVGNLGQLGEKEATVGGIVTALRLLKTKKGDRMATFVLEDLAGGVEVLVFPEAYKKAAARLADDVIVLVKGRAEALDEGRFRLLASDVLPLESAKLSEARFVTIRVPMGSWDKSKGERLRDILGSHKGDCPVTLEMVRAGAFSVAVAPSAYFRVRPDEMLRTEVEGLLGPGSLILARTSGATA